MSKRLALRVLVFDLDCTLWPFHLDLFKFKPPYRLVDGNVLDKAGEKMDLYPETREVMSDWSKKCSIAICSRSSYPQGAKNLMNLFGIDKYVKFMEIYPGFKTFHFGGLMETSGCQLDEMLFFDDEPRNIRDVKKIGVKSVLVDPKVGITKELVDEAVTSNFYTCRNS